MIIIYLGNSRIVYVGLAQACPNKCILCTLYNSCLLTYLDTAFTKSKAVVVGGVMGGVTVKTSQGGMNCV